MFGIDLTLRVDILVGNLNLLTQWSRDLLQKLTVSQVVKHVFACYSSPKFMTTFASARQLYLSWAISIQSIPPHLTFWRSILMLSFHLSLGLSSGLFPSDFPTQNLYTLLLSTIHATCPAYLILDLITLRIICEQYRSLSSSLRSFLHSPLTSSLLGPNILLNTLFANTFNLVPPRKRPSFTPIQNNRQNYNEL